MFHCQFFVFRRRGIQELLERLAAEGAILNRVLRLDIDHNPSRDLFRLYFVLMGGSSGLEPKLEWILAVSVYDYCQTSLTRPVNQFLKTPTAELDAHRGGVIIGGQICDMGSAGKSPDPSRFR